MEWGPGGLCLDGQLGALPLRAFFCSFSVSEDFFLISCRARLYSAGGERRAVPGSPPCGGGNPAEPQPHLSRGPCPTG